MRNILFFPAMIFILFLFSCETEENPGLSEGYNYKAIVKGKGIDCGETFLIELEPIVDSANFAIGTYYADELAEEFKVEDLEIYLNCRAPNADETYACTMRGPTYKHVIVTESRKTMELVWNK